MQSGLRDDAVEEQSTLAKEILDQTGTAVIFADRSGKDPAPELRGCGSVQICGRGGARPEPRPHHSGASAHRTLRGFDGAMKNRALKLEGRPTLTRGQHKNGRKLYVEMTFALVIAAGRRQGRLRSRPTSPNASNARGKWRRHRISVRSRGPYAVGDEHPESEEIWLRCQRFSGPRQARAHLRRRRARREGRRCQGARGSG